MEKVKFELLKNDLSAITQFVELAKQCFYPNADKEESIQRLQGMLKDGNYIFFVAKYGQKVIGILYANILKRILSNANIAMLWCLGVDKEFQKQGVAKGLLSYAINECKKRKCSEIKLTTAKDNIACQKVSENLGFDMHYAYTKEV